MQNKTVVIISQDYDNCYHIMAQAGYEGELKERSWKTAWQWEKEKGVKVEELFGRIRDKYNAYLSAITKNADAVRVYVGSYRQSYELDEMCSRVGTGSVFPALVSLCQERSSIKQPWTFEPLLLADPVNLWRGRYGRNRGEAYKLIVAQAEKQLKVTETPTYIDKNRITLSKRSLLLNQMWDAYRENPEAEELLFYFIDDHEGIITDVLTRLKPHKIPPKMKLFVTQFHFIKEYEKLRDGFAPRPLKRKAFLDKSAELPKSFTPHLHISGGIFIRSPIIVDNLLASASEKQASNHSFFSKVALVADGLGFMLPTTQPSMGKS